MTQAHDNSRARRSPSLAVGVALATLALAPFASAAAPTPTPTPNGQYSGTLSSGEKVLQIHVSADGKTATGLVFCSQAKSGTFPRFPIVNGAFKATDKIGGTPVATATGTIVSATRIKVRLNLKPDSAICDGNGGTVFLKLKGT